MIYTVTEECLVEGNAFHAGGKARDDLRTIFLEVGIKEIIIQAPQLEREHTNLVKKIIFHRDVAKRWDKTLATIGKDDVLILQFPVINHTLFLNSVIKTVRKRGAKVFAFIHDIEVLRHIDNKSVSRATQWRMKKEEVEELYEFDGIIAHNNAMKEYIVEQLGIEEDKIIVLGIFDYLIPGDFNPREHVKDEDYNSCIIAGNLSPNKSKYIYNLPSKPVFELYGVNYDAEKTENVNYHGAFLPEELPKHMVGGFGLVWDGESTETCSGSWGEYLRYNNPHKTSLYLACGIPVIIWKDAALADFIIERNVGITISSLRDIDEAMTKVSLNDYREMKKNTIDISKKLRNGMFTKAVLKKIGLL